MSDKRYALEFSKKSPLQGNAVLLNAGSAKYGGDWPSIPHTHSYVELFYIVEGKGQFRIEDQMYPVNANTLVIVNPNVTHTEVSYNAHPLEYIVLGIEGLELSIGENSDGRFCMLDCRGSEGILPPLRSILREMESQQLGYQEVCQAFTDILLIRLMRRTTLTAPPVSSVSPARHQCAVVRRYIDNHYKEPLSLDLLADEVHINKFYLSHAFKQEYGASPINYMISRRIQESRYLLAETDLSLAQISQMLGFSSASYFSQSFRRSEGISPKDYRKRHHAEKASAQEAQATSQSISSPIL